MAVDPVWTEYYLDEMDAAWLYKQLAVTEPDVARRRIFERLSHVEDAHVQRWRACSPRMAARCRRTPHPSRRRRSPGWPAVRLVGGAADHRLAGIARGRLVSAAGTGAAHKSTHDTAMAIATESAEHAQDLSDSIGREGEPWHVLPAGGYLRSVVYGFNDGLTANFGLVAGVIGANVAPHLVIVTGIAGAVADALSMGSSGYLAAKSEAEVSARQVAIEREEMRMMPDLEEKELAIILRSERADADARAETATAMMRDPQRALEPRSGRNWGFSRRRHTARGRPGDGAATAVGALIPLLPFLSCSPRRHLGVADGEHAGPLRGRSGAQPLHRPKHLGEWPRYVPGRLWRRGGRVSYRRPAGAPVSFVRTIAAVIAGILLAYGLPWLLERVLVEGTAGRNLYTAGDYYAVRNTAGIITARIAMGFFLSVLAGHMAARIAREDAVRTVAVSAAAISVMLIWEFTGGEFAWGTPLWMRIVLVAVTGPAMVLGAYARAMAAELRAHDPAPATKAVK